MPPLQSYFVLAKVCPLDPGFAAFLAYRVLSASFTSVPIRPFGKDALNTLYARKAANP